MVKYRNATDSFNSFAIPQPDGSIRTYNAVSNAVIDVPAEEGWRAEAFGFVKAEASVTVKPEIKPMKSILPQLRKIKGLGPKIIDEIAEEYDDVATLVKDIKAKKFNVGGVDKDKEKLLLKAFG
jgi:hypothetical protein